MLHATGRAILRTYSTALARNRGDALESKLLLNTYSPLLYLGKSLFSSRKLNSP